MHVGRVASESEKRDGDKLEQIGHGHAAGRPPFGRAGPLVHGPRIERQKGLDGGQSDGHATKALWDGGHKERRMESQPKEAYHEDF